MEPERRLDDTEGKVNGGRVLRAFVGFVLRSDEVAVHGRSTPCVAPGNEHRRGGPCSPPPPSNLKAAYSTSISLAVEKGNSRFVIA